MWFFLKYICRCEDKVEHAEQIYVSIVSFDDDFDWMLSHGYVLVRPD